MTSAGGALWPNQGNSGIPMKPGRKTIDTAVRTLSQALRPHRIILFGSRARGAATPASDIDLLLVGDWSGEREPWLRTARLLVGRSFPAVDVVLCTPEDLNSAGGEALFLRSVIETGRVLYRLPGRI
jgi:predicted nucleotidyltransferase